MPVEVPLNRGIKDLSTLSFFETSKSRFESTDPGSLNRFLVNAIKKPTNRAQSRGRVLFLVKKLIFTKIMVLKLLIPSIFWGVITVLVRQVGNNEDSDR